MLWCVAVLAITLPGPLLAQTIMGTWQGTLPVGEAPRIVFRFTKANDGSVHGTLGFIDRDATSAPLFSVTFSAPTLSLAISNVSFRGTMSADGKSIKGTWTQGNQTYPLTLALATPDTIWTYTPALPQMSATADP